MANIEIQNLPSASSPLNGSAYVPIKDGLTDKKATITQLRQIDISALTNLDSPLANDLVMIGRGSDTYRTRFDKVGLVKGTRAWFYQDVAPSGWTIFPGVSDCLLAVKGGSTYTNGGTVQGTWQQEDHILTEAEMPEHNHTFNLADTNSSSAGARRARAGENTILGAFGSTGTAGSNDGHNHGNTWRPLSAVGIVCQKDN